MTLLSDRIHMKTIKFGRWSEIAFWKQRGPKEPWALQSSKMTLLSDRIHMKAINFRRCSEIAF